MAINDTSNTYTDTTSASATTTESPIKHTAGGEMPNIKSGNRITQRFRAAAPAIRARATGSIFVPIVLSSLVGYGIYYFLRRNRMQGSAMLVDTSVSTDDIDRLPDNTTANATGTSVNVTGSNSDLSQAV